MAKKERKKMTKQKARFPEKERELIGMVGEEQFNKLAKWSFEYACREAKYLRLFEFSKSHEEYSKSFEKLCTIRRNLCIEESWDHLIPLQRKAKQTGIPMDPVEIEFNYRDISKLIVQRYKGIGRP